MQHDHSYLHDFVASEDPLICDHVLHKSHLTEQAYGITKICSPPPCDERCFAADPAAMVMALDAAVSGTMTEQACRLHRQEAANSLKRQRCSTRILSSDRRAAMDAVLHNTQYLFGSYVATGKI